MEKQKHELKCCKLDCHNRLEDPYTYGCAMARKQIDDDMDNDIQQLEDMNERLR